MRKNWKLAIKGILASGITGILMFAASCGGDHNAPTATTSTGSITTATGTVAAGTTVSPPQGVTSMTFTADSLLTDSTGAPVTGSITTTVTRSTSASSLPAAAPAGTSLAVLLDIDMSIGTTKVKNFSTPMTVIVAVPAGVTSVDVYSFNGTNWVLEQPGVAISGGNATINITHLSIWACFSVNPLTITTTSPLPAATIGTAYSQTLAASGGTAPYTWAVATGSTLPAGLSLSASGVISGTPTTAGTASVNITVTDAAARTTTTAFSITVNPTAALAITTTSPLVAGTVGTAYGPVTLIATGGTTPYSWALAAGSTLPAGLTLSAAGVISGTPTTAGSTNFSVSVTDSAASPATVTQALTITIAAAGTPITITTTSLAAATFGTAYGPVTLNATGGSGAYTWTLTVGSLPPGLTLNASTGVISGTPNAPAVPSTTTTNFTVGVTGAVSGSATQALAITASLSAPASAGKIVYDGQCSGCHALGIYDASGSPNLSGFSSVVNSRFTGGQNHHGVTLTAIDITNVTAFISLY